MSTIIMIRIRNWGRVIYHHDQELGRGVTYCHEQELEKGVNYYHDQNQKLGEM